MEDFVKFLITPLLSEPQSLELRQEGNTLIVKIADADVGRIIGKQGSVINALRTLVRTYCLTHKIQFINLALNTPPLKKD